MVICELLIELDKSALRPGDVVKGRIRCRLDEANSCALTVGLAYHGASVGPSEVPVFSGALEANRWHAVPFELALPADASPSVRGVASWEVVAKARLPRAFNERVTRTFRVYDPPELYPRVLPLHLSRTHSAVGADSPVAVPGMTEAEGGRTPRSLTRDVASAAAGSAMMAAGVALVAATKGFGLAHSAGLIVPGYTLTRPGVRRVRRWMAERRLGIVRIEYETVHEAEVPRLRVRAYVEPGLEGGAVRAGLTVHARDAQLKEELFADGVDLARASRRGDLFEGTLPVPRDVSQSGEIAPGVRVEWELSLHIDIPRWPDWVEVFPLEVVPARR